MAVLLAFFIASVAGISTTLLNPNALESNLSSVFHASDFRSPVTRKKVFGFEKKYMQNEAEVLASYGDPLVLFRKQVPTAGGTFDNCFPGDKCKGKRKCVTLDRESCDSEFDACFCLPPAFTTCEKTTQCSGEICAANTFSLLPFCVSSKAVQRLSLFEPNKAPAKDGLTLSGCETEDDCKGERGCAYIDENDIENCGGRSPCYCLPFSFANLACLQSDNCQSGEVCANTATFAPPVCVSKKAEKILPSVSKVPKLSSSGLSFAPCRKNTGCQGKRVCINPVDSSPCSGQRICACLPDPTTPCFSSNDCIFEEVCADTPFFVDPVCVSTSARAAYGSFEQVLKPIICPILIPEDPPRQRPSTRTTVSPALRMGTQLNDMLVTSSSRIVGGLPVSSNLAPYVALVTDKRERSLCTGTLLSPRWVVTAAHCEPKGSGSVFLQSTVAFMNGVNIKVKRVFIHPKFDRTPQDFYFDVAILELAEDAPKGSKFMKLNAKGSIPAVNSAVRVIGFGETEAGQSDSDFRGTLRQVDVRIVNNRACNAAYSATIQPEKVSKRLQICAGTARGGCDSCAGDSGGPLIQYERGGPVLVGQPSYGLGCGNPDFPGVYARISALVSWIGQNTPAVFETN